jgi:hypothetical protein
MNEDDKLRNFVEENENQQNQKQQIEENIGPKITSTEGIQKPWQKSTDQISMSNQIGWSRIDAKDLPTQGLFYPEGVEIGIRSASASEIRHWSTLNEDDLSLLDDMLNYVLERCAYYKAPNAQLSSWKDLKEVDRFYLLLAIREKTFIKGENVLQVKISETKKMDVNKDMIQYITFHEKLMKYYDVEKRCIVLTFKTGKNLNIYLPSVGITNWLKTYITRKNRQNESFDQDFLNFAPFIISDWRGLNDSSYEKYIYDSQNWTTAEISMLTEIRKIFADAINPVIRYHDEQGGERSIPLNFQGGIKSIFLISDPFSQLT